MKGRRLRKWLKIAVILYIAGGIALYYLQDAILFHPVQLKGSHKYETREAHTDVSIPINEEDTLNMVRFHPAGKQPRGVVLYFHGNKKNIGWYARFTPFFTRHGYEVMMIDYPGFGKSRGKFTEKTLYDWARQLYKFSRSYYPADSIIIYGKSMGTGIAAYLASREECRRLILETPYYDFPSVIRQYLPIYPVGSMLHYKLPTYQYLQFVKAPVTIFHGTSDWVIRYRNSKRLKRLLKPPGEFISIEGGSHNNLYEYPLMQRKMDSLLRIP